MDFVALDSNPSVQLKGSVDVPARFNSRIALAARPLPTLTPF
jgi:hypothetical protein